MKPLLLCLGLVCILPLRGVSQQTSWFGIMHGTQFSYAKDYGTCDDNYIEYQYSPFPIDYCVGVTSLGLPDHQIYSLYITPEEEVMVGTQYGMQIYYPNQTQETYNFKTSRLPKASPVEAVFKDSQGRMWMSSQGDGIFKKDKTEDWDWAVYQMQAPFGQGTAYRFVEDYLGEVWACGDFGVAKYVGGMTGWLTYNFSTNGLPMGPYTDMVWEDDFSYLWLAHQYEGLIKFSPTLGSVEQFKTATHSIASDFLTGVHYEEDSTGLNDKVWYSTADNGFGFYETVNDAWTHYSAANYPAWSNNEVMDMDRAGAYGPIWLATQDGVVQFHNGQFVPYRPADANHFSIQNRAIAVNSIGEVWVGTQDQGIGYKPLWAESVYQRSNFGNGAVNSNSFRRAALAPIGEVWVVGRDNPGEIALFRSDRLSGFNMGNQGLKFTLNDLSFTNNYCILGADEGIWTFDYRTLSNWHHFDHNGQLDKVNVVERSPAGEVFLGTTNGLYLFDLSDSTFTDYTQFTSGLPDNHITAISFTPNGDLWLGTKNSGLVHWDRGTTWTTYNTSAGLPNNEVNDVFFDFPRQEVYVATRNGLVSFNTSTQSWTTHPDASTSPLGQRFRSIVVDEDGTRYAGTVAGFAVMKADSSTWQLFTEDNAPFGDNYINDVLIDQEGNKWMIGQSSTAGGLFRYTDGGPGISGEGSLRITGEVFWDENANGIKDSLERPLENRTVVVTHSQTNERWPLITDALGRYYFTVKDTGLYFISPQEREGEFITNGAQQNLTFPSSSSSSLDTLGLISFAPLPQPKPRLVPGVYPAQVVCGKPFRFTFVVNNVGNALAEQYSFGFSNPSQLSYRSFDPRFPDQFQAGKYHYIWRGDSLPAGSGESISLSLPTIPLNLDNTQLRFNFFMAVDDNGQIDSTTGQYLRNINCAVAPEDLVADPPGIGAQHLIPRDTTLIYTIHFQNRGNQTARLISILDTLDANLDPATLQLLFSSHQVSYNYLGDHVMNFQFVGINLPDTSAGHLPSQGQITFSIKPDSLVPAMTHIQHRASITMDQQPAYSTNPVFHTIAGQTLSTEPELAGRQIYLQPNPAVGGSQLVLHAFPPTPLTIRLLTLQGQVLSSQQYVGRTQIDIPRQQLPAGMYLIEVKQGEYRLSKKLIFQ